MLSDAARLQWEGIITQAFVEVGEEFAKMLLAQMLKDPNPAHIPPAFWIQYSRSLRPPMADGLMGTASTASIEMMAEPLIQQSAAAAQVELSWTLANQQAKQWAETYSYDLVRGLSRNGQQALQKHFARFFTQKGMTVGQLSRLAAKEVDDLTIHMKNGVTRVLTSQQRGKLIATTEVTRAGAQGEQHVAKQVQSTGIVELVAIWNTQEDAKVCPICRPRNEKEQGDGWTDPPPGHPGCFCGLSYEPVDLREILQFQASFADLTTEQKQAKLAELQAQLGTLTDRSSPEARKLRKQIRALKDDLGIERGKKTPPLPPPTPPGGPMGPRPLPSPFELERPLSPEEILPVIPPGRAPRARGVRMSSNLKVRPGKAADEIKEALAAIDEVHGDGNLETISIGDQFKTDNKVWGSYYFRGTNAVRIDINAQSRASHKRITTAHEVGHFLDHQGLGSHRGSYASRTDPELREWREAMRQSASYKKLQETRGKAIEQEVQARIAKAEGLPRPKMLTYSDAKYLDYLLSEHECFARSYSQYIATRSSNQKFKKELIQQQKQQQYSDSPSMWSDEDFEPIAQAFDELFARKGWRG